eukprot:CAMPEP_0114559818 /NCGR_PEP_ID=MMETSP0114-20121206/11123_1 /TAXON_ID=31324 /ORGANISM="Goniomonas sp, Strain m" /LENGTH=90 /DNA_ID=CAMNT_0001745311 /DNA_START=93 /DNA_END=365 /DNA_ORIENTATION=+
MKSGAKSAASSTERAAKKTKLQAEIKLLEDNIKDLKKGFGLCAFDHMDTGDQGALQEAFQQFKEQIDAKKEKIADKRTKISALEAAGEKD